MRRLHIFTLATTVAICSYTASWVHATITVTGSPVLQADLDGKARQCADFFQRSSSRVEGRTANCH